MKICLSLMCLLITGLAASHNHECQSPTTELAEIQGLTNASKYLGETVWVKGIVTADFRGKKHLGGYFIQSLEADDNPLTSEGMFIQENNLQIPLKTGDLIVTQGQVSEQFGVTQLTRSKKTTVCSTGHDLPAPFTLQMPLGDFDLETIEGMYITLDKPYVITDVYPYVQYGELVISSALQMNPTSLHRPGPAVQQLFESNRQDRLIVDDGRLHKYALPFGISGLAVLNADNQIQVGQTLKTDGVMHYAFGQYKLQALGNIQLGKQLASSQQQPQAVGGSVKIASFNVENFFTTIDNGEEICGPMRNFACRGADNLLEYQRQLGKLVSVINNADVSVVGLQELENNNDESIAALVQALNEAAGHKKWSYVDTGELGEDVIKVGLIYQNGQLKLQGDFALLNKQADPKFLENKNRVIVAQTFSDFKGNRFNVATVHFKSKSCRDAAGIYLDQKDGQGCYNPTRVTVAKQLSRWLKADPTGQQASATFIVGDFNSYQFEDPMVQLQSAGFYDLAKKYLPANNWTTSYRGQVGSLDYVLGNKAAQEISTGLTQWHINSVVIDQLGYNTEPLTEGVNKPESFYQADPYASSDHDVVIVGVAFN